VDSGGKGVKGVAWVLYGEYGPTSAVAIEAGGVQTLMSNDDCWNLSRDVGLLALYDVCACRTSILSPLVVAVDAPEWLTTRPEVYTGWRL